MVSVTDFFPVRRQPHTLLFSVGFCFAYRQNLALFQDSLMNLSVLSAGVTDVSPDLVLKKNVLIWAYTVVDIKLN